MRSGVRVMDTIIVEKKRGRRLASNFLLSLNTVTSVTLLCIFVHVASRDTAHSSKGFCRPRVHLGRSVQTYTLSASYTMECGVRTLLPGYTGCQQNICGY